MMANCVTCGKKLTSKEAYYYGNTCNTCERKAFERLEQDVDSVSEDRRMTMDRKTEIQARVQAATPGKWEPARDDKAIIYHNETGGVGVIAYNIQFSEDADFIVHAPDDIRWLMDENDHKDAVIKHQSIEIDRLTAELDRTDEERIVWQRRAKVAKEELARWRNAEKDGRMVVLPVPIGTTIYRIVSPFGVPDKKCVQAYPLCSDAKRIGETVFLTREEAQAALQRDKTEKEGE